MNMHFSPATSATPASAAPTKRPPPDAELIALGRQLDDFLQRLAVAEQRFRRVDDDHRARAQKWRDDHPGHSADDFGKAYDELASVWLKEFDALEASHESPDGVMIDCEPISKAILAIPATSIAGLAVKARLAKFGASGYWREADNDVDWDKLVVRKLIDAVIGVAASLSAAGDLQ